MRFRRLSAKACIIIFPFFLATAVALSAQSNSPTKTKIIPLPIFATLPNEGNTYGFMPVFLTVRKADQHTLSIIAPSISWNRIIRFTHTFRWYYYPTNDISLTVIPSISTHVNRGITLEFSDLPLEPGRITNEAYLHARRSIFYRFFGIGPQSKEGDESSYTRVGGEAGERIGYNITRYFNAGLLFDAERELVERKHVDFLPLTNNVFPGTPGLGGATTLSQGISLRYDTRPDRQYSKRGWLSEIKASANEGLSGTRAFGRVRWQTVALWPETDFANGASRFYFSYTPGSAIPFYDQSILGGSFLLRGFTEDRFIDKGSWEYEIEQRIRLFQTHIYGVVADWRVDPFIAIGQVYHDASNLVRYTKFAGGLGFRAFVRPNVLGRVDMGYGGEGLKFYVELGYPF